MARPPLPIEDRRTGWVTFRASPGEIVRIDAKAARFGLSQSAYSRQRTLSDVLMPRLLKPNPFVVAQLVGLDNNVNQIAKHANAGRGLPPDPVLHALAEEIHDTLDRLFDPVDQ